MKILSRKHFDESDNEYEYKHSLQPYRTVFKFGTHFRANLQLNSEKVV